MSEPPKSRQTPLDTKDIAMMLGFFHLRFSALDIATDYAIGQFLNTPREETYLITSGMVYGRKARLLSGLIKISSHPKKDRILETFNKVIGDNKRDILLHGYTCPFPEDGGITFIERSVSGNFKAIRRDFSNESMKKYVKRFSQLVSDFISALGIDNNTLDVFSKASLNFKNKPNTSPHCPID
jgi:hypothetical protein